MVKKRVKIDKFGRIIVPKKIRSKYGIDSKTEFLISDKPEGFLLTPLKKEPSIIEDDGLLIINGQLGIDNLDEFIKKQREEKIVKVLKDIGKL